LAMAPAATPSTPCTGAWPRRSPSPPRSSGSTSPPKIAPSSLRFARRASFLCFVKLLLLLLLLFENKYPPRAARVFQRTSNNNACYYSFLLLLFVRI
jgi:hypothetical protein